MTTCASMTTLTNFTHQLQTEETTIMFIYLFIFNHLLHGDTITFKRKSTKSTPAIVGLQKNK